MRERQVGTTTHPVAFLLVASADHVTGVTGAAPAVAISKDGAAFGAASGAVSELANGWYSWAGNATDRGTNGGLAVHITAATADPADFLLTIVPWDPFDANLALSRLDATITSRLASGNVTIGGYAAGQDPATLVLATPANKLATDTSGRVTVASIVNGAIVAATFAANALDAAWSTTARTITGGTITTNSDKTGYALSTTGVQAIWDALTSALTTVGSVGKRLADNLDATVSTRSSHTAADVWTSGTRTLSAFGFSVDLSGTALAAIWDRLLTAITTTGSIGKLIKDNLDAKVSSVGGSAPTAGTVAAAVWDEAISGHLTAGSTGAQLAAAGSAGDPLLTTVPGAYGAGTAGFALGHIAAGVGALGITDTIYDTDGTTPLADVDVWYSTDAAETNVVARGRTDAFGVVQPHPQLDAGAYYRWRQKTAATFANPTTIVVS